MPDDNYQGVLVPIEECVERLSTELGILRLSRERAILNAATVAEDTLRLNAGTHHAALVGVKYALNHLMRWINQYCATDEDLTPPRVDAEAYGLGQAALSFAQAYDWLLSAFRQHKRGDYVLDVRPPLLRFVEARSATVDRRLHDFELWRANEDAIFATVDATPRIDILRQLALGIRFVDEHTIEYDEDPAIAAYYHGLCEPVVGVTLPLAANNGKYTIAASRDVWIRLQAMSMAHTLRYGLAEQLGIKDLAPNSRVLRFKKAEFLRRLSLYPGASTRETVEAVVNDLTTSTEEKVDLRARPLIRCGETILLLPYLLMGLPWEPCTQLLWSRHYSGEYGSQIAARKSQLARDFAALFDQALAVSSMRKLYDERGAEIGDADVAVYDEANRHLALFELKWLVPPEDVLEVSAADAQLLKGVEQAALSKRAAVTRPQETIRQLFPQDSKLSPPLKVDSFVLSRGSIGGLQLADTDPPIFDYDRTAELLTGGLAASLREFTKLIPSTLRLPPDAANYRRGHEIVKLCDWDIRIPGLTFDPSVRIPQRRNDPCDCDSGLKFKKCCGA